jgi:hypothetical protein
MLSLNLQATESSLFDLVKQSEKDVVDLTVPGDLYSSDAFGIIRYNPEKHMVQAIDLLTTMKKVSEQQKLITIYSMYRLEKGLLEESVLMELIAPAANWRVLIVYENYKDPNLIELLNSVKNNPKTKINSKKQIENILSGKPLKEIEFFLENQFGFHPKNEKIDLFIIVSWKYFNFHCLFIRKTKIYLLILDHVIPCFTFSFVSFFQTTALGVQKTIAVTVRSSSAIANKAIDFPDHMASLEILSLRENWDVGASHLIGQIEVFQTSFSLIEFRNNSEIQQLTTQQCNRK